MASSTITSLAILTTNWERLGTDYVENFVPFVVESLRKQADDVVSLPALQAAIAAEFGLDLPLNPLRQVLQRAAKHGFLRTDAGVFRCNKAKCDTLDFAEKRHQLEAVYDRVRAALQDFAREKYDLVWDADTADSTLVSFLADGGLSLLFVAAGGSGRGDVPSAGADSFVVAAFVTLCRDSNPALLADLETLSKGSLLADALFLPDQGRVTQKFRGTRVYLDTSLLIFAAGFTGARADEIDEISSHTV